MKSIASSATDPAQGVAPSPSIVPTLHAYLSTQVDFTSPREEVFDADSLSRLSVHDYLCACFHLLRDDVLRGVIAQALAHAQQAREGLWGGVIDTLKVVLQERRALAAKHFQQLVQFGLQGDLARVDKLLRLLYCQGCVDHLFEGLLAETKRALEAQLPQSEEQFFMLVCFDNSIAAMKEQPQLTICSPVLRKLKLSLSTQTATQTATHTQTHTQTQAAPTVTLLPAEKKKDSEREGEKTAVVAQSLSAQTHTQEEEQEVRALLLAGDLLNSAIRESAGDVPRLQQRLFHSLFVQREVPLSLFLRALQDNILACEHAGYTNKLKLLNFLRDYLLEQEKLHSAKERERESEQETSSILATHHAPQFVDERLAEREGRTAVPVVSVERFLDAETTQLTHKPKNNKKKAEKKAAKLKALSLAEQIAAYLDTHGWAVVDHAIPLDVIRRLRIEFELFRDHFEQAEIWVGKRAEVGAHLRVPSVRGDKVLWMCGGHQILDGTNNAEDNEDEDVRGRKGSRVAPEGVSRVVKTHGEIEPCKLEIKAAAPLRKFIALKEVVNACDKIVSQLKGAHWKLGGIYERSDAMLAVYPGEGARFANHIDNTTQDGRRLTLLVYLNPNWVESQGGALRVTETIVDEESEENKNDSSSSSLVTVAGNNDKDAQASVPRKTKQQAVDIYPLAGRMAMFFSSEIPHEVLPTYGERFSLTVWYYDREERKRAIAQAKESGMAAQIARTSEASQQAAKAFIGELMGGDEIGVDGGDPTAEELAALAEKVTRLSDEVLDIVGNITGAPSVQSFREGFPMLTVQDLKSMRALFRRMGLQG